MDLATTSGKQDDDLYIARDYQVQLLSMAQKENVIIFLPTGSGKTFVAVMLIKHLSKDLELPYKEGGKRTFFAVNTVALVAQQGDYIARHTHLTVGKYSGDLNLDTWSADRWDEELKKNQVIVLTCQILLDMLSHGFLSLENINLIIFDECHHAVSDHCMRRVMQQFEKCPKEKQPRVLGLSATLLNSNCKANSVKNEITNLETTFLSKVATIDDIEQVKGFSTNPIEKIIYFDDEYPPNADPDILQLKSSVVELLQTALETLNSLDSSIFSLAEDHNSPNMPRKLQRMNISSGDKEKKKLSSIIKEVQLMIEELGIFGGYIGALYSIILLNRRKLSMTTAEGKLVIANIITQMTLIRKLIYDKLECYEPLDHILKFSKYKILKLLEVIKTYEAPFNADEESLSLGKLLDRKKGSMSAKSCCLIFVERRQTAKILYQILKHAAQYSVHLKDVRPEFVLGIAANPSQMESSTNKRRHQEAIQKFRSGECNYLVASDVMEEGVDIPLCSMVMKLDLPKTFRSYVQSKGRARHSSSKFYMFLSTSNTKFMKNLEEYHKIEEVLKQILIGKTNNRMGPSDDDIKDKLYDQEIPPYYSDDKSASVNLVSATSLISRYCSLLPQDKFTMLQPTWILESLSSSSFPSPRNSDGFSPPLPSQKLAYLQLPINAPIRNIFKGLAMRNKRNAKRTVALIACVHLHRKGELGKYDLLPVTHVPAALDDTKLFPHWIDEKNISGVPGSKKMKRVCRKEVSKGLCGSHPKPGVPTYVYHIFQVPVYDPPSPKDSRGIAIYNVLNTRRGYAILSSKKLPQVCDFSIFMSSGEIDVKIQSEIGEGEVILDAAQIEELELFHMMLFLDLLNICKQFFVVDKTDTVDAYLLAPTCLDTNGKWIIDWAIVKNFPMLPPVLPLTPMEIEHFEVNEKFLHEVVTPWYRGSFAEQHYVVTQVCEDLTSRSPFPSISFSSFEHYFQEKYDLNLSHPDKPLLEVKKISSRIDCTHPKGVVKPIDDTPSIMPMSKRQMQLKNGDFLEHLIPELVTRRYYPSTLWLKATALPTILHRFTSMQLANELREQICIECNITNVGPPKGKWKRLEVEAHEMPECEPQPLPSGFFNEFAADAALLEAPDLDHDIDHLCLLDVVQYHKLEMKENESQLVEHCECSSIEPEPLPESVLHLLQGVALNDNGSCQGPELADTLSALTAATSGDVINLERLETLGDSFLKFAASTFLYLKYPEMDEGKLTMLKGKIISNRNLYYCGKAINLGGKMKVHSFAPQTDWTPPGFTVPSFLKEKLNNIGGITKNILFQLTIPESERRSGRLSRETQIDIMDALNESQTNNTIASTSTTLEALLGTQSVPDKSVADSIEALIGAWLKSGGGTAALRLLGWFGVFPHGRDGPAGTWEDLVGEQAVNLGKKGMIKDQACYDIVGGKVDWGPNPGVNTNSIGQISEVINGFNLSRTNGHGEQNTTIPDTIDSLLLSPDRLEKCINYQFKNRSLLLQALTHASYYPNCITECYQRLEFLGDAVLDFLITCHIYETGGKLNPGQLTDLRSALVNNITFASLAVRYGLYRHLLYLSPNLMDAIDSFVEFQQQRGYAVTEDCLVLMEEEECCLAEAVEVPKALGDILESLAGAIFLDSGLSLTTVWQVFYPMMKNEIAAFIKKVPKQPVRELLETNANVQFMPAEEVKPAIVGDELHRPGLSKQIIMVPVKVTEIASGKERVFYGFGEAKSLAKRAAAKLALRAMGKGSHPTYMSSL